MVSKMLKYTLLIYHRDTAGFMESLRKLGVAHVDELRDDLPKDAEVAVRRIHRLQERLRLLDTRSVKPADAESIVSVDDLLHESDQVLERLEGIEKLKRDTARELQVLEPWGEIPAAQMIDLQEKGVYIHLFSCSLQAFDEKWNDKYLLEVINRDKKAVWFAVISGEQTSPDIEADKAEIPSRSLLHLRELQSELQLEHRQLEERLDELAGQKGLLQEELKQLNLELEWLKTVHQKEEAGEGTLHQFRVWIPAKMKPELDRFLTDSHAAYLEENPEPADNVPILLKNGKFSNLFHPIGDLFALPSYAELDLTPYFAPFFTLFFGMCLGDVGYGLLILAGLTFVRLSGRFPSMKKMLALGQFLGASAVLFGFLTGTVFGADLSQVHIPMLERLKLRFLQTEELFNLSLMIGLFQILFGMTLRVINKIRMYGFVYGLSSMGWIAGILGGGLIMAFDLQMPGYILLFLGIALILFFSDPSKGIFTRVGIGLWDLYGITGLFGDVLSYVRLFALGLSSGILGLVVNNIAFSTIEGGNIFGYLAFLIILLIGHGLNFAISTLSAFVHPVRLTFVEFYKNAGFIGGGKAYNPFGKHYKKSEI